MDEHCLFDSSTPDEIEQQQTTDDLRFQSFPLNLNQKSGIDLTGPGEKNQTHTQQNCLAHQGQDQHQHQKNFHL